MPDNTRLAALRPDLLRFARLQLRDDAQAEDIVQETLIAAMSGLADFAGRSALRTWVFSILKNKLADTLRTRQKTVNSSALAIEGEAFDEVFDTLFKANAHWAPASKPSDWGDPHTAMEQRQFWIVFDACLKHLPPHTGRIFMMREFLDLDIDEICADLGISASNCYVALHRARHQLRGCLERNWFEQGDARC